MHQDVPSAGLHESLITSIEIVSSFNSARLFLWWLCCEIEVYSEILRNARVVRLRASKIRCGGFCPMGLRSVGPTFVFIYGGCAVGLRQEGLSLGQGEDTWRGQQEKCSLANARKVNIND
jgi:hypothetical protein